MTNKVWPAFSIASPAIMTMSLAALLLAASGFKDLLLLAAGRDVEISIFFDFLSRTTRADSWNPIYDAIDFVRSSTAEGLYQTIFFDRQTKFQYPPTSLLPFLGLSFLGVEREGALELMRWVSFLSVLGIVAATARLLVQQLRLPGLRGFAAPASIRTLLVAGVAAGTFSFYPIMYGYELGQIQIVIDLAVTLALLAWLDSRKAAAGALLALGALIKPQYALVLVWALLRGERDFMKGFLIASVPVALVSLLVFGLEPHLEYLSVLSYIGSRGEVSWPNQSVNGLLNRLSLGDEGLRFDAHEFAPFNPLVYGGTLVSSAALVLFALAFRPAWARRAKATAAGGGAAVQQESLFDLSTMLVVLTIASPIAWEHHYGVTWPMIVAALCALADLRARRAQRAVGVSLLGLGVSYLLVSNYLTPLRGIADTPLNVLQSYVFFGGLALIGALAGLRVALQPPEQSPTA